MLPHNPEIVVQYIHYQALMHEPEEERLIQALGIVRRTKHLCDQALDWLGSRLACRGKTVEKCHDTFDCAEPCFNRR
jgi:hypothetical protein